MTCLVRGAGSDSSWFVESRQGSGHLGTDGFHRGDRGGVEAVGADASDQEQAELVSISPTDKLFIVGKDRALVRVVASDEEMEIADRKLRLQRKRERKAQGGDAECTPPRLAFSSGASASNS